MILRATYVAGRLLSDGGITILSYHAIDQSGSPLSVPERLFAEQMRTLKDEGCQSFTMREVAQHIAQRRPFPARAVAITFDDGFASVARQAMPLLVDLKLNATVYVITSMVGCSIDWELHEKHLPALELLAWSEIRSLHAQHVEIGAHSVSHRFLPQCSPHDVAFELGESRRILEREVGAPVTTVAYPQGGYSPEIVCTAKTAGYQSAVTVDQGRARVTSDPFRLPRLHVGSHTSPAAIKAYLVPTIGPTYRLVNLVMHRLLRRREWPGPGPQRHQSVRAIRLDHAE